MKIEKLFWSASVLVTAFSAPAFTQDVAEPTIPTFPEACEVEPNEFRNLAEMLGRAAEYGFAQLKIGLMYSEGRGVLEDDTLARTWLLRAAEQGNAAAQYFLALMYRDGEGGPEDAIVAYAWAYAAAEQDPWPSLLGDEVSGNLRNKLEEEILAPSTDEAIERLEQARALGNVFVQSYASTPSDTDLSNGQRTRDSTE